MEQLPFVLEIAKWVLLEAVNHTLDVPIISGQEIKAVELFYYF
jgi:hypothetical protein